MWAQLSAVTLLAATAAVAFADSLYYFEGASSCAGRPTVSVSNASSCFSHGTYSLSAQCFGNATSFAYYPVEDCAGVPSFQGSSVSGTCGVVTVNVSVVVGAYVIYCGDSPTPSMTPSPSPTVSITPSPTPRPVRPPYWSQFGKNAQHTGRSPYVGSQLGALKWSGYSQYSITYASPVIGADGTVYLHDVAYLANGTRLWSTNYNIISSYAIASSGAVIGASYNSELYAFRGDNGATLWTFSLYTGSQLTSSPTLGPDDTVYIGGTSNSLYAVNGTTGALRWRASIGQIYSSPSLSADGSMLYVGSDNYFVYALNASTGAVLWKTATGKVVDSSPAVTSAGLVIVGSADTNIYGLSGATGNVVWHYKTGDVVMSSPAISANGMVVVGSNDHNVYGLEAATGVIRWIFVTEGLVQSSAAVDDDGTAYIGCSDKNIYALSSAGVLKWMYRTSYPVQSSPAISSDGTVYAASGSTLYAFHDRV